MVVKLIIMALLSNLTMAETVQFGGELFLDGQDARSAGMGGYSISIADGRNPLSLIPAQGSSVHFSLKDKFSGLSRVSSVSYLNYGTFQEKKSPIFIKLVNRNINNISDTRSAWVDNGNYTPEIGEINYNNIREFSQNELGLKVAFLHRYNNFALGICLKPTYTNLAEFKAWGISGDVSTLVQMYEKKIGFSLRVEDILSINKWSTGKSETMVPLITAGGQIQLASFLLGIDMGSKMMGNSPLYYHVGVELHRRNEIVILRGGLSHDSRFSLGIGLNFNLVHIDYVFLAPSKNSPFEQSQIISVGIFLEKLNWIKGKITP
jgi:hypothetical protein